MGGDNTEKITIMVLKVDLECSNCYKKAKKVLCKFPQIQDQVYDEKANTITIKVLCCNPERIRDKLCCKGRGVIKSIEIKEPPKPKKPEKPDIKKEEPKDEKLKASKMLKEPECVMPEQGYPRGNCCEQCYEGNSGGPCYQNWYGRPVQPVPPAPCYDNSYGYGPAPGQYTFPKSCCVNKCEYFSEENASGCSIM